MPTDDYLRKHGQRLTSSTPNPRSGASYFGKDEPLTRSVSVYVYEDMRGQLWLCSWMGQGWIAKPTPETKAFYNLPDGNAYAGSTDAKGLIGLIEEKLENIRIAQRDDASSFWFLLLVVAVLFKEGR